MRKPTLLWLTLLMLALAACGGGEDDEQQDASPAENSENQPPAQVAEVLPQRPPDLPTVAVEEVINGHTLRLSDGQTVRLIGVNTPASDEPLSEEATAFVRERVNGEIGLEAGAPPAEGDTAAYYIWAGDELVNFALVQAGYAYYRSEPPNTVYDVFLEAGQSEAVSAGRGVWQVEPSALVIDFVVSDPAGEDTENVNGEYVVLANRGEAALNLEGYRLRDYEGNRYVFGSVTLAPGQRLRVYSGYGTDTVRQVYWGSDVPVWDNTGEIVLLQDASGRYLTHFLVTGS